MREESKRQIILGLGSNQGDRRGSLEKAIELILEEKIIEKSSIRRSKIIETKALLPKNAPDNWDINFYNMAIFGETPLKPEEVLIKIKNIEKEIGRIVRKHWAPREIDIDILLIENLVLKQDDLQIPHKHFLEREFALVPAAEAAPDFLFPDPESSFFGFSLKKIVTSLSKKNNN